MKKTLLIITTIIISLIFVDKLEAITGYTTKAYVAVRSEPRVASETFVYQLPSANITLNVLSEELYNVGDTNCKIGWYKINYEEKERYICGEYVSLGNLPDDNPDYNEKTFQARVNDVNVTARSSASYGNNLKHYLLPGTNLTILGKEQGSGCSGGWYKVKYFKNSEGYVCSNYVKTKEELTSTNKEYEQELKKLGFPDSYIPYLTKLHEDHPSWVFNPIKTKVEFNNFVKIETRKNYINNTYLNSIVDPLYQLGPSNETGWSISTDAVNAFFLDPRNFLTESFIFMFERLNYDYKNEDKTTLNKDSEQTKYYYEIISSLLSSSYANTDDYKYWFIGAGFKENINPVYLTSLSYQEGPMSNPNNPSILGTHSTKYITGGNYYDVNGYYNFFNIHAYWHGENSPTTSALAYACGAKCSFNNNYGQPWDTREKAIYGGAKWIAEDYIAVGQNTMYFKKFNSSPTSNFATGTHQYQTNVTAPCSESVKEYEAYTKTGSMDNAFVFDIPIYENMPSVVSLPEIASTINTLNDIKIEGKSILHDKDLLDLIVYVPDTTNTIKIEVDKTDQASTVTGIGSLNLTQEQTEHQIIVTAENGSTRTYRITIIKVKDTTTVEDIINKLSVKVNGNIMNHISPDTLATTLKQSILKNSPNAQVTIYNKNGSVIEGGGLIETGGSIKIIAPSGETKTFTTVVTGDTNGDGTITILDLLRVQKQILGSIKL